MRRLAFVLSVTVAGSVGCQAIGGQTLTEEMPAAAQGIPSQPSGGPAAAPVPVPIPVPAQPAPQQPQTPAADPTPQPTATPPPSSGNGDGRAGSIHHVRVGFFGVDCRNGKHEPNNGAREVPAGCVGHITATPKKADNSDVPLRDHGSYIRWELEYGGHAVDIRESIFPSTFNRDAHGTRVGDWKICAYLRPGGNPADEIGGCMAARTTP